MEKREIKFEISLEQAKQLYKSGYELLKKMVLLVYSEDELEDKPWKNIKTFEDACNALGINSSFELNGAVTKYGFRKHLTALYKLDIIRQALNKDYEPSLTNGLVYYPWIRIYKNLNDAKIAKACNNWEICNEIKIEGTPYYLVGGDSGDCTKGGISYYYYDHGDVLAYLGLFCCKSREIAQHMSKHFAKEIFDVCYIHHLK
jgi:hypothetical protein